MTLVWLAVALLATVGSTRAVSVVGIDLGHLYFKQALVASGTYDIVLNEQVRLHRAYVLRLLRLCIRACPPAHTAAAGAQSGRRTSTLVAAYEGDRFFGNEAKALLTRTPRTAATDPLTVLGRPLG